MTGERDLVRLAVSLGATSVGGPLTPAEAKLVRAASSTEEPPLGLVRETKREILAGGDPLGDWFCDVRSADIRRRAGAIYTPGELVDPMVNWVLHQRPGRVVDAGAGSGRFSVAVARKAPELDILAVDTDPLSTIMTRGALASLGVRHAAVLQADYTQLALPNFDGRTAFLGNPPYVRHHQLTAATKLWAQKTASKLGHPVSGLAGLHALFFIATAAMGRPGDVGCFVTSAEWLDVNYGAIVRALFLGSLGGEALHVLEPESMPFEKTTTTAVVVNFRMGVQPPSVRFRPVRKIGDLGNLATTGEGVARARLAAAPRWSPFVRTRQQIPEGYIELGELCRVHRGAVTGSNSTWITRGDIDLPDQVLFASVTRARELFEAGEVLTDTVRLRRVIDIPAELDQLDPAERERVERFIRKAKQASVHRGYIAAHRRAWWSVGLRKPAPILATYMARRPPAFVLNAAAARHINIAHGLYPRQELSDHALRRLAACLRTSASVSLGRTYAGGLTKFEPKEMERLPVPDLDTLLSHERWPTALVS
ncbi:MAG: class I SAM-dependent methyltransferase [Actinomycetota bacterium]|nr:class I SAM-dependent methyltransferase [Actinomycetota bacterium]